MKAAGRVWLRPASVAALAVALAAGGWTADARPAENDAEAGNAIENARSDYEAITDAKAGRTPAQLPLPKQAMPRLDLKSDALPLPPNPAYRKTGDGNATPGEQPGKSENWLIEAMNQTAAETSKETVVSPDTAAEIETPKGDLLATAAALERAEQAAAKAREAQEEKVGELPAFNPLDAYMTGWLSARDLGRSGTTSVAPVERGAIEQTGLAAYENNSAQRDVALVFSGADAFSPISEQRGLATPGVPETNPYLGERFREWNDGASPTPLALPSANPEPLLRLPDAVRHEPTPMEPKTPPRLSEELKAQDDAKYFKQLKRF